jgi:hypothetical protein
VSNGAPREVKLVPESRTKDRRKRNSAGNIDQPLG